MGRKIVVSPGAVALVAVLVASGVAVGSLAAPQRTVAGVINTQIPSVIGTEPQSVAQTSAKFPKPGDDAVESLARVAIVNDPACATGKGRQEIVNAGGPTVIRRGKSSGGLQDMVPTEITMMELEGSNPNVGMITIRERADKASTGQVMQIGKDKRKKPDVRDLPATSFFDVWVELEFQTLPGQKLVTTEAVRMQNNYIRTLPPIGSEYRSALPKPLPLVFANGVFSNFCLIHAVHVPEDPSHVILFLQLVDIERKLDALCKEGSHPGLCPFEGP